MRLLYTPILDFSPWADRLAFEFRSRELAESFAALNDSEIR